MWWRLLLAFFASTLQLGTAVGWTQLCNDPNSWGRAGQMTPPHRQQEILQMRLPPLDIHTRWCRGRGEMSEVRHREEWQSKPWADRSATERTASGWPGFGDSQSWQRWRWPGNCSGPRWRRSDQRQSTGRRLTRTRGDLLPCWRQ